MQYRGFILTWIVLILTAKQNPVTDRMISNGAEY